MSVAGTRHSSQLGSGLAPEMAQKSEMCVFKCHPLRLRALTYNLSHCGLGAQADGREGAGRAGAGDGVGGHD